MKRVIIVRHAKAVPYGYDDDYNRDLSNRGEGDAAMIGSELRKHNIKPDVVISSPAKRALKTARIFAQELHYEPTKIIERQDIYDGQTTSEFLDMIHELPESATTAFFFGHNPGFYYFVCNLLPGFHNDMPTCSTVAIDFTVDSWSEIEARTGHLAFHLAPRMLK